MTASHIYDTLAPTRQHMPSAPGDARAFWNAHHRSTGCGDALAEWDTTTSTDGRPLHTARVTCLNPDQALQKFVMRNSIEASHGTQQLPFLDYSEPGRIQCLWLLNGEWICLWAPDSQAGRPVPFRVGVTPSDADRLLAAALRATPSGRLPFTRRTKKESPAA